MCHRRPELSGGPDTPVSPCLEPERRIGSQQEVRAYEECAGDVSRRGFEPVPRIGAIGDCQGRDTGAELDKGNLKRPTAGRRDGGIVSWIDVLETWTPTAVTTRIVQTAA
jgi:hypothetical protein